MAFFTTQDACKRPTTPVCGLNGETYSSKCVANDFRVLVDYEGHCSAIGYEKGDPLGDDVIVDWNLCANLHYFLILARFI